MTTLWWVWEIEGSAPSAQSCSDSGLKLFQDQKGQMWLGNACKIWSGYHCSYFCTSAWHEQWFTLCDFQLELHEKCMSKLRGEKCVTFRSDLPHTCRKKTHKCQVPFREGIGKVWWQRTKTSWFGKEAWLCLDSATSCWCWAVGTGKLFHGIQFVWDHCHSSAETSSVLKCSINREELWSFSF